MFEVSAYAGNMLTVEIRDAAGGRDQTVASVALHSAALKNTLHFTGKRSITDVFHPDFANCLLRLVQRAKDAPTVLTPPDVIKSRKAAVVARMRMLVNTAMNGGRHIIIRFACCIGSVACVFRRKEGALHEPLPHRERLAVQARDSICSPLGNIAMHLDRILEDRNATEASRSRMRQIEDETVELKFYTELLRRYVDDCARDRIRNDQDQQKPVPRQRAPEIS